MNLRNGSKQSVTTILQAILLSCLWLLSIESANAHGSFEQHKNDFYTVLSFEESQKLTEWMRLISSKLIDNAKGNPRQEYNGLTFYDYLKQQYPPFKCKHRLLFHWGYNSRPWSHELDLKMEQYKFEETTIKQIQQLFIAEQKYRNRLANEETEKVFGFASSGKDAGYANAFISLVYDIHLLGDYTPDNKDLDGVSSIASIVGDVINSLRKIDNQACKQLIRDLNTASKRNDLDVQYKAELLLAVLTDGFKFFLKNVDEGKLVTRLAKNGIVLQNELLLSGKTFLREIN